MHAFEEMHVCMHSQPNQIHNIIFLAQIVWMQMFLQILRQSWEKKRACTGECVSLHFLSWLRSSQGHGREKHEQMQHINMRGPQIMLRCQSCWLFTDMHKVSFSIGAIMHCLYGSSQTAPLLLTHRIQMLINDLLLLHLNTQGRCHFLACISFVKGLIVKPN